MCILFFHLNSGSKKGPYRLILASNRDEYYIRQTRQVEKWSKDPDIISGIDLEPGREGGTWLGLGFYPIKQNDNSRSIRVGALLNITGEERHHNALGRGFIVTDYLKNIHQTPQEYVKGLQDEPRKRNAFNFVAIDLDLNKDDANVYHYSNVGCNKITEYNGGTLAFGNSLPDNPLTKVKYGETRFQDIVDQYGNKIEDKEKLVEELLQLLRCEQRHLPDPELERRAEHAFEYLSSIFVRIPEVGYGSRTHTIILVTEDGKLEYIEHTMDSPIDAENPCWIDKRLTAHL